MRVVALSVGAAVFILDFATKLWVQSHPELRYRPIVLVEGLFRVDYLTNEGIVFGLLGGRATSWQPMVLSLIGIVALLIVLYYIARMQASASRLSFVAMGALLGGIGGNLTDRLLHRHVIDFLTLHWDDRFTWPTFNVADSAITAGICLLLVESLLQHRRLRAAAAAMVLLALPWPTANAALQASALVDALQQQYQQVQTLKADFEQILVDRGISLRESGLLIMKKPGMMYWEYQQPSTKYFVADGTHTYFWVPEDNQVFVSELDLVETSSPLLFLLGRGDLNRDFLVDFSSETADSGRIVLQLNPRTPQPDFDYLLLEIDPAAMLIYRLSVIEPVGQRSDYLLTNIERNIEITDKQFQLDYPPDIEIVRQ